MISFDYFQAQKFCFLVFVLTKNEQKKLKFLTVSLFLLLNVS